MSAASFPTATQVYCCRLDRSDGVSLGFTSHDRALAIDGFTYRASPGLKPTSIERSARIDDAGLDFAGSLSHDALSEEDLRLGRWDGARVRFWLADWREAEMIRLLAEGRVGEVAHSDGAFTAELLGWASRLGGALAPTTSPGCRAHFCDAQCGLSRAKFTHRGIVLDAADEQVTLAAPIAGGVLAYGSMRLLSGSGCGLTLPIAANEGTLVSLDAYPPLAIAPGTPVLLREGCDGDFATCRDRFGNAVNFRGEPHLPGMDLLTRYPGG